LYHNYGIFSKTMGSGLVFIQQKVHQIYYPGIIAVGVVVESQNIPVVIEYRGFDSKTFH